MAPFMPPGLRPRFFQPASVLPPAAGPLGRRGPSRYSGPGHRLFLRPPHGNLFRHADPGLWHDGFFPALERPGSDRGDDGLVGIMRDPVSFFGLLQIPIGQDRQYYFLVLAVFVLSAWACSASAFPAGPGPERDPGKRQSGRVRRLSVKTTAWPSLSSAGLCRPGRGLETLLESNARPFMAHWATRPSRSWSVSWAACRPSPDPGRQRDLYCHAGNGAAVYRKLDALVRHCPFGYHHGFPGRRGGRSSEAIRRGRGRAVRADGRRNPANSEADQLFRHGLHRQGAGPRYRGRGPDLDHRPQRRRKIHPDQPDYGQSAGPVRKHFI